MVNGMEIFRRYFAGYEDAFVLIGGAACDEWFTRAGGRFRTTKDIDVVLVLEAVTPRFQTRLWSFVQEGGYETGHHQDGTSAYFRFLKPATIGYPKMIELFSSRPTIIEPAPGQRIIPIPHDERAASLSAILMDSDYYNFVMNQRQTVAGLPLLKPAGLILLKAKAWLDLAGRRAAGDTSISRDDVDKHRTDLFRLAAILPTGETIQLPSTLAADLGRFLSAFPASAPEWPAILQSLATSGINTTTANLLSTLNTYFQPTS